MSTHAAIGIMVDGKITAIYSHFDGYISHTGRILLKYYDEKKTLRLVSIGDVSSLGTEIGEEKNPYTGIPSPKAEGTSFPKYCRFYTRDYEENNADSEEFDTVEVFHTQMKYRGCEYFYLMHQGKWWVISEDNKWMALDKAIVLDALTQD